jgi:hypothetical protein
MAKRTKLWVGVGVCMLVGSTGASAEDDREQPPTQGSPTAVLASAEQTQNEPGSGGKGGQGGGHADGEVSGGEAGIPEPVRNAFAGGGEGGEAGDSLNDGSAHAMLVLIRADLRVAAELYEQRLPVMGARHLDHPYTNYYNAVAPALIASERAALKKHLVALADFSAEVPEANRDDQPLPTSAVPGWDEVQPDHQAAVDTVDEALDRLAGADPEPRFIRDTVLAVLRTAEERYAAAVEDGTVVDTQAYQHGAGMAFEARQLLAAHREAFEAAEQGLFKKAMGDVEALMKAWARMPVPETAPITPSQLAGGIARFELTTSGL